MVQIGATEATPRRAHLDEDSHDEPIWSSEPMSRAVIYIAIVSLGAEKVTASKGAWRKAIYTIIMLC